MPSPPLDLARSIVEAIPFDRPTLFNPWREACPLDSDTNGPSQRLERLASHLDCPARFLLVGEAPGYQGCRYSGVAFTSERLLGEGAIPRIAPTARLSKRHIPFSEPSATIVWGTLYQLGMAEETVLWNALQMHPFRPGQIWSNRTPTREELAAGAPAMRMLRDIFPSAKVIAVGRKAEGLLADMGIATFATVRHPANGGASEFARGLRELLRDEGGAA